MKLNGLRITPENKQGRWYVYLTDHPTISAMGNTLREAVKAVELQWKGLQASIAQGKWEAERPRPVVKKKYWRTFPKKRMM